MKFLIILSALVAFTTSEQAPSSPNKRSVLHGITGYDVSGHGLGLYASDHNYALSAPSYGHGYHVSAPLISKSVHYTPTISYGHSTGLASHNIGLLGHGIGLSSYGTGHSVGLLDHGIGLAGHGIGLTGHGIGLGHSRVVLAPSIKTYSLGSSLGHGGYRYSLGSHGW